MGSGWARACLQIQLQIAPDHTQSAAAGPGEDRYDDNDYDCEEGGDYEGQDDGDDYGNDDDFVFIFLTGAFICTSSEPQTK